MTVTGQQVQARPDRASRGSAARWAPLAVLLCGTFMFVLDKRIPSVKYVSCITLTSDNAP